MIFTDNGRRVQGDSTEARGLGVSQMSGLRSVQRRANCYEQLLKALPEPLAADTQRQAKACTALGPGTVRTLRAAGAFGGADEAQGSAMEEKAAQRVGGGSRRPGLGQTKPRGLESFPFLAKGVWGIEIEAASQLWA